MGTSLSKNTSVIKFFMKIWSVFQRCERSCLKMPYLAMLQDPSKSPRSGSGNGWLPKFNQIFPGLVLTCVKFGEDGSRIANRQTNTRTHTHTEWQRKVADISWNLCTLNVRTLAPVTSMRSSSEIIDASCTVEVLFRNINQWLMTDVGIWHIKNYCQLVTCRHSAALEVQSRFSWSVRAPVVPKIIYILIWRLRVHSPG